MNESSPSHTSSGRLQKSLEILIGQQAQLVEDRSDVHPIIGVGIVSIGNTLLYETIAD